MSGQFARLQQSLHRAHPTALNQRIEVFANDLNAILEHYVAVSTQSAHDTALLRQVLEALESAVTYHGVMLLSDPPRDAWKFHGVERKANAAIAALKERLK